VDYAVFLRIGPFMVVLIFATLLPFLVLSWINPLFRERLKNLLHLEPQKPILQRKEQEQL